MRLFQQRTFRTQLFFHSHLNRGWHFTQQHLSTRLPRKVNVVVATLIIHVVNKRIRHVLCQYAKSNDENSLQHYNQSSHNIREPLRSVADTGVQGRGHCEQGKAYRREETNEMIVCKANGLIAIIE
jgi:hypothetical protein